MNPTQTDGLSRTPLTDWHRAHGARMVPFAGFEMPVQYAGVAAEHAAVRERVGLFDITHMGEIHVRGAGAEAWLDGLAANRVAGTDPGRIVYTAMCAPDGGVLDDMLVYRLAERHWLVVCNAANRDTVAGWLAERARGAADVALEDASDRTAMIAVQGPASPELLARLEALADVRARAAELPFYGACTLERPGGGWIVSRTGYTGERGYELYVPWEDAPPLWEELLARGAMVEYHDPWIPSIKETRKHGPLAGMASVPLTAETLAGCDAALIATDHTDVDYELVVKHAPLVVDTRNATRGIDAAPGKVVRA